MKVLRDYQGLSVRLSDERLAHILEHPEMGGLERAIEETLAQPEKVFESFSDPDARIYYRTAYLTDKVKRGVLIWPKERSRSGTALKGTT